MFKKTQIWLRFYRNWLVSYLRGNVVVHYTGYLLPPGGGRIQVDFSANKKATPVELDAAFLAALSHDVEINYLPLGEEITSRR